MNVRLGETKYVRLNSKFNEKCTRRRIILNIGGQNERNEIRASLKLCFD